MDGEQSKSRWEIIKGRLKHSYRFVIMTDDTFEEVRAYRLTLLNAYILVTSVLVVVTIAVVSLIAFTPLRKYVPGYGSVPEDTAILDLYSELEVMEKELDAYRSYSENFRKMLVGDVQTEEEVPPVDVSYYDSLAASSVPVSEAEEELRQEAEMEQVGAVARSGRITNFPIREVPLEQMYFTSPLNGEVAAGFMPDKGHYGIDILAPKNTAIKAAMDGYVFFSDWTLETGNTIGIQHTNNVITFYKHNATLLKKAGNFVRAGEGVAIIGNTGELTSGPHLHFELWHKGKPVDPGEYVDF